MISDEPIDLRVDDPAVQTLLPRYLQRRTDDVAAARAALSIADYDTIATLGHRMRGSGSAYGIPLITEIGTEIERAAQATLPDVIEAAMQRLENYLSRVRVT